MPKAMSYVLETKPAKPKAARKHFAAKLEFETDPFDVHEDLKNGVKGVVVLDARRPESFEREHIKGAAHLWHRAIDKRSVKGFSKKAVYVVYCTGVGCNASTKAAYKLSKLGFKVKEMSGGLTWWKGEGYPTLKGKA